MHLAATEGEVQLLASDDQGGGSWEHPDAGPEGGGGATPLAPLLSLLGLGDGENGGAAAAPLGARARAKIRSVVLMLRRHAQASQEEAELARRERDAAVQQVEEQQRELQRVKRLAEYMSKYTSEVEDERDGAREALRAKSAELAELQQHLQGLEPEQWAEDLEEQKQLRQDNSDKLLALSRQVFELEERLRSADAKRWSEVAQGVESALLCGGVKKATATPGDALAAEAGEFQPPALVDMSFEDLQWECVLRGIPPDGSLAALRIRVRAARARDRRGEGGDDAGAAGGT